jgi:hypothetical protein
MTPVTGAQLVSEVEKLASQADYRYVYGGDSPSTGFDCSGLMYAALMGVGGSDVPRTSEGLYAASGHVTAANLQVGDLVYAQFAGDGPSPGHVGIYTGNGIVYSAQNEAEGIGPSTLASWGNNIVGYGTPPGVSFTGSGSGGNTGLPAPAPSATVNCHWDALYDPLALASCVSGAAGSGAASAFTGVLSSFGITPSDMKDGFERAGIMLISIIALFMGVKMLSSGGSSKRGSSTSNSGSSGLGKETSGAAKSGEQDVKDTGEIGADL